MNAHQVHVCRADYAYPRHAQVLVEVLDAYARDPMGGGEALSDFAKANLVTCLATRPAAFSVLAFEEGDETRPMGLVSSPSSKASTLKAAGRVARQANRGTEWIARVA